MANGKWQKAKGKCQIEEETNLKFALCHWPFEIVLAPYAVYCRPSTIFSAPFGQAHRDHPSPGTVGRAPRSTEGAGRRGRGDSDHRDSPSRLLGTARPSHP